MAFPLRASYCSRTSRVWTRFGSKWKTRLYYYKTERKEKYILFKINIQTVHERNQVAAIVFHINDINQTCVAISNRTVTHAIVDVALGCATSNTYTHSIGCFRLRTSVDGNPFFFSALLTPFPFLVWATHKQALIERVLENYEIDGFYNFSCRY